LRRTAILSYVISGVLSSGLYFYLLNLSSRWGRPESTIASRLVSPLTLLNFLIKYLIGSASRRGTHAAEFILLGGVAILVNRSDDCTGALESTAPIVDPGGPGLRLTGWAWDVKHQRPPLAIVVTTNGIITGIGAVGGWRPDVAAIQPEASRSHPGYIAYLTEPLGISIVNLYAILQGSPATACQFAMT